MPLSEEDQKIFDQLKKKMEEPAGPPANINFNLDLSSDSAWERAKKLGLVRDDPPAENNPEDDGKPNGKPARGGYFGA